MKNYSDNTSNNSLVKISETSTDSIFPQISPEEVSLVDKPLKFMPLSTLKALVDTLATYIHTLKEFDYLFIMHFDLAYYLKPYKTNTNLTALHIAAQRGDLEIIRLLLFIGMSINDQSKDGETPLHYTMMRQVRHDIPHSIGFTVDFLISQGANINAQDNNGKTPLHYASEKGYTCVVSSLIVRGANINVIDKNGCSPFCSALLSDNSNVDIVQIFIKKGVDANKKFQNEYTPLYIATYKKLLNIIPILLAAGANQNDKGNKLNDTPFKYASKHDILEIIKLFNQHSHAPQSQESNIAPPSTVTVDKLVTDSHVVPHSSNVPQTYIIDSDTNQSRTSKKRRT